MSYAAQIVEVSELFFNEHPELDAAAQEVLAGETVPTVLNAFKEKLTAMTTVDAPTVKAAIKEIQKKQESKAKLVYANSCCCLRTNARTRITGYSRITRKRKST